MVISHKHRYLFIEIPLTASWAIHHELCQHYAGQPILHKHASYPEFQRRATADEKSYFVFATVRHPLDALVSGFLKYKTDHQGVFSNADESLDAKVIDYADVAFYKQARQSDVTFESTFLAPRIWERPYSEMIELSSDRLDFVIRYEHLQEGFTQVLDLLGIEQARPVPIVNKTDKKKASWESYYTPPMIEKAKKKCGPFMQKWDYAFPPDWGEYQISVMKKLEFRLVNMMKKIYLTNFRYSDHQYAVVVRKLHSQLRRFI